MAWDEYVWLAAHTVDPGLREYYEFEPNELYFCIGKFDDFEEDIAVIVPKEYFDNTGFVFDQEIQVKGLDWFQSCESYFEVEGDNPRQHLLDLGLEENLEINEL